MERVKFDPVTKTKTNYHFFSKLTRFCSQFLQWIPALVQTLPRLSGTSSWRMDSYFMAGKQISSFILLTTYNWYSIFIYIVLANVSSISIILHLFYIYDMQNNTYQNLYILAIFKITLPSTGIFSFCLMVILAGVSLPSVASSLSWREFSFMQRYLGWWAFIFGTLHIVFLGWDELIKPDFQCVFIPTNLQVKNETFLFK